MAAFFLDQQQVIRSRAHRILKRMTNYTSFDVDSAILDNLRTERIELPTNDELLGIYTNAPDEFRALIIISTLGIRIFEDAWLFISYAEISDVSVPLSEEVGKLQANTLLLELASGDTKTLLIKGGDAKFRDVWEFSRFMNRAIAYTKKRQWVL